MNNDVSTNKYIFTNDWFQHNIESWNVLLQEYVGKENLCFLEIGSYQGMSTAWLMEHVLTHPSSKMYCMDTFEGSVEHSPSQKADLFAIFCVFRGQDQSAMRIQPKTDARRVVSAHV